MDLGDANWMNDEEFKLPTDLPSPKLWRVLVVPVRPRRMSRGAHGTKIVLPDVSRENEGHLNYIGKVVAIGPLAGRKQDFLDPDAAGRGYLWDIKVGDWVIYGRYTGQKMEYRGVKFLVINDDEILASVPSPDGFRMYV
jgi:chaperonin GroES